MTTIKKQFPPTKSKPVRTLNAKHRANKWYCEKLAMFCLPRGTVGRLATYCKVSPSVMSRWVKGIVPIPAEQCLKISRFTNGQVNPKEMRPDIDWTIIK